VDEELRQALVQPAESDLLDQLHDLREPLAVHAENEAPERLELEHQLVEHRRRHREERHVLLGDAARRVVGVPEQAAAGEDAALAGVDAVEQDLAAVGRELRHAHAAFEQQGKAAAGLGGVEKHGAGGHLQELRLGQKALQARRA
jgi:hypothetical protein